MSSKLFRTRQGTILLGVVAAVLAAIALIVYLNHYRSTVNNTANLSVLVAKSAIPQNTSGRSSPPRVSTRPRRSRRTRPRTAP